MSAAVPGHRLWGADAVDAREDTSPSPDGEVIASVSACGHGVRTTGARPLHGPDARSVPARRTARPLIPCATETGGPP